MTDADLLRQLVAAEHQLEQDLMAAHARAEAIVREAEQRAEAVRAEARERRQEHLEQLRRQAEERANERAARELEHLATARQRLEALDDAAIDQLAGRVLEEIFPCCGRRGPPRTLQRR